MADNKQEPIDATCLLSLPPELLAREILPYLPLKSLIQSLATCRQINELINSSVELTYLMELEIAGMIDNRNCSYTAYPVIQRLEMLRERESRWSHFDRKWRRQVEFPPRTWEAGYDVAAGLYLCGKLDEDFNSMPGLYCGNLPSDRDSSMVWRDVHLGKTIIHFTELVENDLLAIVSIVEIPSSAARDVIQVDFLALSTGLPHPLAASPTVDICKHRPGGDDDDGVYLDVKLCGENLAFMYEWDGPGSPPWSTATLHVWNWRRGERKAQVFMGNLSGSVGIAFLQEDFLMHTNAKGTSLDIFHISPSGDAGSSGADVRIFLSLSMPELLPGCQAKLRVMSHPSPWSLGSMPNFTNSASRPFFNDPHAEIILITSSIFKLPSREYSDFALLVHRKSLLVFALSAWETHPSSTACGWDISPHNDVSSLGWDEWGPGSTRIFPNTNIRSTGHSLVGQRWISITKARACGLELVDFNQIRVQRTLQSWSTQSEGTTAKPGKATKVTATTEVEASVTVFSSNGGFFVQDVHSYLPSIRTRYSPCNHGTGSCMKILGG